MNTLLTGLVTTCVFCSCFAVHAAEPGKKPTGAEAKATAEKWLGSLGDKGLVIEKVVKEGGFEAKHAPSALGKITKFSFQEEGWWVTLSFKGELTADTPVKALQKQFWHATLDRLPTPGLDLPGWDVRPRTPVSSFSKGVEVLAFSDGKLKVRIQTGFFALSGNDPSVLVPADAPSPAGSYFQIRKPFLLDLTLEAPFKFK